TAATPAASTHGETRASREVTRAAPPAAAGARPTAVSWRRAAFGPGPAGAPVPGRAPQAITPLRGRRGHGRPGPAAGGGPAPRRPHRTRGRCIQWRRRATTHAR